MSAKARLCAPTLKRGVDFRYGRCRARPRSTSWLNACGRLVRLSPNKRSVVPDDRYAAKCAGLDRHVREGRERQMSGHQKLASRRQLPQKIDADAGRLLGIVFEAVLPVGVFEPDLEHGVAGERQPIAARRQADHTVPGSMAAGATDN